MIIDTRVVCCCGSILTSILHYGKGKEERKEKICGRRKEEKTFIDFDWGGRKRKKLS